MIASKLLGLASRQYISPRVIFHLSLRYKTKTIKGELLQPVAPPPKSPHNKVSIIGVGQTGMATAISLLTQNVTSHIALVDRDDKKLLGEALDLNHGAVFLNDAVIEASTDFAVTKGSRICIITAGVRTSKGKTRLDIVQDSAEIIKKIVPEVMKHNPDTILMIMSNPVDVLTYLAWKLSKLPKNRVIGTGTLLDTARFNYLVADQLGVAPSAAHGMILGEHGNSSVSVWSGTGVAGMSLQQINRNIGRTLKCGEESCFDKQDTEKWSEIHKKVVMAAPVIMELKGYTNWAVALCTSHLTKQILTNSNAVLTVSTNAKGTYGMENDVFLSLPCIVNGEGISGIVKVELSEREFRKLKESSEILQKVQCSLKL